MALSQTMESLLEAQSAAMGGIFSTTTLFPLEIIKTKVQASRGESTSAVIKKLMKEQGLLGLYRGVQSKAAESAFSKFLYFYFYSTYHKLALKLASKGGSSSQLPYIVDVLIGYLAEGSHLPVTLPFEVISTRLQTNKSKKGVVTIVKDIVTESGVSGLYRGWAAYLVLCLQPAIQYSLFEKLKSILLKQKGATAKALTALQAFLLGAVARAVATILVYPYIRAKVLAQSQNKASKKSGESNGKSEKRDSSGLGSVIAETIKNEGVLGLYRGLGPELFRGVLSSALMLMMKEKIYRYNRRAFLAIQSKAQSM